MFCFENIFIKKENYMKIILFGAITIVLSTIFAGIYYVKAENSANKPKLKKILRYNFMIYLPLMLIAVAMLVPDIVFAAESGEVAGGSGLGFIAAALSTGLATLGAGYAVGAVGSSALGAVSEDPSILGKTLIFVGLAEGIAIYGLIISILILGRL